MRKLGHGLEANLLASIYLPIYNNQMSSPALLSQCEHPLDVLSFAIAQERLGLRCALAMLTDTVGGSVRATGAIMAISQNGQTCGYLSGGCIDADIRLHALQALSSLEGKSLRYGQGSPFLDISLPCGGGIDVFVCPTPDPAEMHRAVKALEARKCADFTLQAAGAAQKVTANYLPKLRIRIAGRSADPIALGQISAAAGIETELWSADEDCLQAASQMDAFATVKLTSPSALPLSHDDMYTAFVLMMHDQDWEPPLLEQALNGSAFYIGAVGSPNTHTKRCANLRAHGLQQSAIDRIKGPIGLVPSMRDASMLAISALAEIIGAYHDLPVCEPTNKSECQNA